MCTEQTNSVHLGESQCAAMKPEGRDNRNQKGSVFRFWFLTSGFWFSSALRLLDQRDKNRGQLIGFVFQGRQSLWRRDSGLLEQFEPVKRLLQLHKPGVHLRGIFGGRTTANCLAIVSTNRGPAAKQLIAQNTCNATLRQRVVQLHDPQRVASSSILQILHRCIKPETRNQKPEKQHRFWFRVSASCSGFDLWLPVLVSGFWFLVSSHQATR
jgi:hypothetical protein